MVVFEKRCTLACRVAFKNGCFAWEWSKKINLGRHEQAKMRPKIFKMRPKMANMRLKMARMKPKLAKMRLKIAH